jgi:hypothetical protein
MEPTTLIALIISIVLAIERLLTKARRLQSKCCCADIDLELQTPRAKKPTLSEPTSGEQSGSSHTEPDVV